MFTGIIEALGVVKSIGKAKNLIVLTIDVGKLASSIKLGDSVAINGVCLTATSIKSSLINFDLMKETISITSLKQIKVGGRVNLELAMKANGRFGGHFVTGHVDALVPIKAIQRSKNYVAITLKVPVALRPYLVIKGSVAIDGISLTVGKLGKDDFTVHLIPFTLKETNLGTRKVGDVVNVETDILAKYILAGGKKACN